MIKVIELFAGVGGFRLGLERSSNEAGSYQVIWSNQWEPATKTQHASQVYVRNFGEQGHSNVDIAEVKVEAIPDADLLVGGFPCQDYSVASTLSSAKGLVGKKGVLWWEIHRILSEKKNKPAYLLFENVDRLLKSPVAQRGRDFAVMLASLSDLGYAVEWRVINAADYGMPQRRKRVFFIAYRDDLAIGNQMQKNPEDWIFSNGTLAKALPVEQDRSEVQSFMLEGALDEISLHFNKTKAKLSPFLNAGMMVGRKVSTTNTLPAYHGLKAVLGDVLLDEKEVPESYYISEQALEKWQYLKGSKAEKRHNKKNNFWYEYNEGSMSFPDALDKPSRTIITAEGGASPSRFKHVIQTPSGRFRRLVPIELERLSMFPDNHTEGFPDTKRAFFCGNALVVGVVERIGRALLELVHASKKSKKIAKRSEQAVLA